MELYNLKGAREAALYPVRIRLLNGVYPAYADCSLNTAPSKQLMGFINRRYEFGLADFETTDSASGKGNLIGMLIHSGPNSASAHPVSAGKEYYEIRSWFEHGGVLNCRPLPGTENRMAVSFKGGHNAEPHNHNDLGTFVVAVGEETLILDPGKEVYTARTFSKARYDSKLLNSYGHPVPVVAGQLQQSGAAAKAVLVAKQFTDQADTYELDLHSAYPVPTLRTLTRAFRYSRAGKGALTVTDDFTFQQPETFATALVTYSQWKQISTRELLIFGKKEAVKVDIETGGVPFKVTAELIQEDNGKKTTPTRIGISLEGTHTQGKIVMSFSPSAPR